MSETIPKAMASTSGDVRNYEMKPNLSKQDYAHHPDTYRGGYKPRGRGGRGRGGMGRGGQNQHRDDTEYRQQYTHPYQRGGIHNSYLRDNRYPNTRDRGNHRPSHSRDDEWNKRASSGLLDDIYDSIKSDNTSGIPAKNNEVLVKDNGKQNDNTSGVPMKNNNKQNVKQIGLQVKNNNKQGGQLNDGPIMSNYKEQKNGGPKKDTTNSSRKPNPHYNKRDQGGMKTFNGSRESLYNGPNNKKPRYPMGNNNQGKSGPPRNQPFNKRGGDRDKQLYDQRSLLNEISNVLVQAKSYPELFSYESLCEELLKQKPIENTEKKTENAAKKPEKRKKAPLKNGVKLISKENRGQGNIPNEYKRRKKPSRMTILNRIRRGLPVHSDDDDFEDEFLSRQNQKTGAEKKQIVMEAIQRLSRERSEQAEKQKLSAAENVEPHVTINEIGACHCESDLGEHSSNSESSFDDSEDEKEYRKSEAQKLSINFSNNLTTYLNKKSQQPKDLSLYDLKSIIQARSGIGTNVEDASIMKEDHVVHQLENMSLEESSLKTNSKVTIQCELKDEANLIEDNTSLHKGGEIVNNMVESVVYTTRKSNQLLVGIIDEADDKSKVEEPVIDTFSKSNKTGVDTPLDTTQSLSEERYEQKIDEKMINSKVKKETELKDPEKPPESNVSICENNDSYEPTDKRENASNLHKEHDVINIGTRSDPQTNSNFCKISSQNSTCVEPQMCPDKYIPCPDAAIDNSDVVYDMIPKEIKIRDEKIALINDPEETRNTDNIMETDSSIETNKSNACEMKFKDSHKAIVGENTVAKEATADPLETNKAEDIDDNGVTCIVNGIDVLLLERKDEISRDNEVEDLEMGEIVYGDSDEESDEEDDENMVLLKALTAELIASGKDPSSETVLKLLQEKMKLLSLNSTASNTQDTAEGDEPKDPTKNDGVIVCADTDDDEEDDDDDDDDDAFPIIVAKDN